MRELGAIIDTYGAALARVAASYEADRALQEDLTQDILLAVHRSLPNLRAEESLAAFIFRIAHNRGVTHVMRQVNERQRIAAAEPDEEVATPEQCLLAEERAQQVAAAVRRLPLPYRQVMTLLLEELSHAEIAEALGLTRTNVGVRVARAKAMLRELLDDR